eukprot:TRINITY_DN3994_c0_g1_i10.p1 TRINITY_DN3994_c0_g1~~TRINITY_DN3994_c0_g1_i10.p1  ORF type:complete len:200 (-),score=15.31 TRINITY_DN3994_c0_g1_i10:290-889(-)
MLGASTCGALQPRKSSSALRTCSESRSWSVNPATCRSSLSRLVLVRVACAFLTAFLALPRALVLMDATVLGRELQREKEDEADTKGEDEADTKGVRTRLTRRVRTRLTREARAGRRRSRLERCEYRLEHGDGVDDLPGPVKAPFSLLAFRFLVLNCPACLDLLSSRDSRPSTELSSSRTYSPVSSWDEIARSSRGSGSG